MPYPLLLHGAHAPGPVRYEPFSDWLVPWSFGDPAAEHRALTEGAGLFDYSMLAVVEVSGEDRVPFLHNLLTNDIKRLAPGQGCRAALLTPEARVIAPMLVLAGADACRLMCDAAFAAPLAQALEGYVFSERVAIANQERGLAALAVQGRGSLAALSAAGLQAPAEDDRHRAVRWHALDVHIVRHALLGSQGALLLIEAGAALRLWGAVQRAAGTRVRTCGWDAYNTARIEAGIPWFGIDADASNLLPETGLEARLVSDTKGCYVGQEIVARVATYGSPSQRVRGLVLDGEDVPQAGDEVRLDGAVVGRVTSSCRSLALGRPVALGMFKRTAYAPGTRVTMGGQTAVVVEQPVRPLSPGGSARTPAGG